MNETWILYLCCLNERREKMIFNGDLLMLMLLVSGILLMILEVIMPGFGAPGIMGMLLVIISINLLELGLVVGIIYLIICMLIALSVGLVITYWLRKSGKLDSVVLKSKDNIMGNNTLDIYLNREGVTLTKLKPSGFMMIDDDKIDVMTSGEFLEAGVKVKVIEVEGTKIIVRRI